jgi:ATP-dependent DNA helicase DinG
LSLQAEQLLSEKGPLADALAGFELRPQQREMARAVQEALEENKHLMVEAGTGVGKSFAYLIPAMLRAGRGGPAVVVSTHTIALQEQLMEKDIPLLRKVLPVEVSAVLVKGRNNYLSLRRLTQASSKQETLFPQHKNLAELHRIEDWAYATDEGSLSDLTPQPDPAVWATVRSDHGNCMGRRCATYDRCFYHRARRRAETAQILVVNHALLFSDLALRQQGVRMLPDYDVVIIDEAHTVESVAAEYFGSTVAEPQVGFLLNGLQAGKKKRGFLASCGGEYLFEAVDACRQNARNFFNDLRAWAREQGRPTPRITEPNFVGNPLSPALRQLRADLLPFRKRLETQEDRYELGSYIDRCEAFAAALDGLIGLGEQDRVYWMEIGGRRTHPVTLRSAPIEVGPVLREALFDSVSSVILTSATLSVSGEEGLDYLAERLGADRADKLKLGSPFNYAEQVELHIEPALPEPNHSDYFEHLAPAIRRYLEMTEGHALVLFTSYSAIRDAADRLREFCERRGYNLMVQGEGMSRTQMLSRLRDEPHGVIFGTESFWNGVDVPGDSLQNVIIAKLPFDVPDHPLVQARMDRIRSRGGSPFRDYQLPEAVLRFKQGFGRLIRSRRDRGIVAVLDSRVARKAYGRRFLEALPECKVISHAD